MRISDWSSDVCSSDLIGAYQSTQHWGDLLLLFGIGVFSWILRILDWPRIPFVIGFVLSAGAERYLFISMSRYGYDWMTRPMVLIIGALILIVIVAAVILTRSEEHTSELQSLMRISYAV